MTSGATVSASFFEPDPAIVRAMDAEPLPEARVASNGRVVALLRQVSLPALQDFGRAIGWIGQWRVDLECPADPQPAVFRSIAFLQTCDGTLIHARIPRTRGIWGLGFSPDCTRFAVALVFRSCVRLAVVDTGTGAVRHFPRLGLNARMLVPLFDHHMCRWFGDGRRLLCRAFDRAPRDCFRESDVPHVWSTTEPRAHACESHLVTAQDAKRLEALCGSDLVVLDIESGITRRLGIRDLITDARPSPDGTYVSVTTLRFTSRPDVLGLVRPDSWTTVWDISQRTAVPVQEIGRGRFVQWAPHVPSRLIWVEPSAESACAGEVVRCCEGPFRSPAEATTVALRGRAVALRWTSRGRAIVTTEPSERRGHLRRALLDLDARHEERVLALVDGEQMMTVDGLGGPEVFEKDGAIFVSADGAAQSGESPRLDRFDLRDGSRVQVLAGRRDEYRECVGVLNTSPLSFLAVRESRSLAPRHEIVDSMDVGRPCVVSDADASPELMACERHLLEYERADGAVLSSVLHVPRKEPADGGLFPVLFWVYPRLTDGRPAPDARVSMNRFRTARGASPLLLLLRGYAVLVTYTFPLVRRGAAAMDSFVEQMVMNAEASVEALVRTGLADPGRIGIGGHSYGAFLVANLLAHTRLFRAGIARSGAYNRAMTPFGYLNEPRAYWEAVATYTRVSPVSVASRIEAPLLLIHGAWDENEATAPPQSRQLYEALRRVGTPTRYVHLPLECHGFGPEECARHAVAEMIEWCDRYVARAPAAQ